MREITVPAHIIEAAISRYHSARSHISNETIVLNLFLHSQLIKQNDTDTPYIFNVPACTHLLSVWYSDLAQLPHSLSCSLGSAFLRCAACTALYRYLSLDASVEIWSL